MRLISQWLSRGADLVYPSVCHLCNTQLKGRRCLCDSCADGLTRVKPPFCEICGECFDGQIDTKFKCPNCHDIKFSFDFARAAFQGHGGARKLIHDFKYGRQIHLAAELATQLVQSINRDMLDDTWRQGILVPVPLHWRRMRQRKFNQAEEIARHVSAQTKTPFYNALKRIRHTETQTRFSRKKRQKNLRGAFAIKHRCIEKIKNQSIILLDDVFTTGSTADACAQILINNGAKRVAVLTVLRG